MSSAKVNMGASKRRSSSSSSRTSTMGDNPPTTTIHHHHHHHQKRHRDQDSSPDSCHRKRNRRMFGALMGHLGQARAQIEKDSAKLECRKRKTFDMHEKNVRTSEHVKRLASESDQRQELVSELRLEVEATQSRIAQAQTRCQMWSRHQLELAQCLKTSTRPSVYYVPARHTQETTEALASAKALAKEAIDRREKLVDEQVEEWHLALTRRQGKLESELKALSGEKTTLTLPSESQSMMIEREEQNQEEIPIELTPRQLEKEDDEDESLKHSGIEEMDVSPVGSSDSIRDLPRASTSVMELNLASDDEMTRTESDGADMELDDANLSRSSGDSNSNSNSNENTSANVVRLDEMSTGVHESFPISSASLETKQGLDVSTFKVIELRDALREREASTKGRKAELVERLQRLLE